MNESESESRRVKTKDAHESFPAAHAAAED